MRYFKILFFTLFLFNYQMSYGQSHHSKYLVYASDNRGIFGYNILTQKTDTLYICYKPIEIFSQESMVLENDTVINFSIKNLGPDLDSVFYNDHYKYDIKNKYRWLHKREYYCRDSSKIRITKVFYLSSGQEMFREDTVIESMSISFYGGDQYFHYEKGEVYKDSKYSNDGKRKAITDNGSLLLWENGKETKLLNYEFDICLFLDKAFPHGYFNPDINCEGTRVVLEFHPRNDYEKNKDGIYEYNIENSQLNLLVSGHYTHPKISSDGNYIILFGPFTGKLKKKAYKKSGHSIISDILVFDRKANVLKKIGEGKSFNWIL